MITLGIYISDIIADWVPDKKSIPLFNIRREMLHRHYPTWSHFGISIALAVLRMVGERDISTHGLLRFLYIAQGNDCLTAHDCKTYIYNNGASTIFAGLFTEDLLSRCRRYAQCAEGAMWCIITRGGLAGRSDLQAMEALSGSFAAMSTTDEGEIDGVEGKGKGKRRRNARLRSWARRSSSYDAMEEGGLRSPPN